MTKCVDKRDLERLRKNDQLENAIRNAATEELISRRDKKAEEALKAVLQEKSLDVRTKVGEALKKESSEGTYNKLLKILSSNDRDIRDVAHQTLQKLGLSEEEIKQFKKVSGGLFNISSEFTPEEEERMRKLQYERNKLQREERRKQELKKLIEKMPAAYVPSKEDEARIPSIEKAKPVQPQKAEKSFTERVKENIRSNIKRLSDAIKQLQGTLGPRGEVGAPGVLGPKAPIATPAPALQPAHKFAQNYSPDEVVKSARKAAAFAIEYIKGERSYFKIARLPNGIALDGYDLDPETLKPTEMRVQSAASKECLDIAVLVKALKGDKYAVQLAGGGDPVLAKKEAVKILTRKIRAYKEFNRNYSGFGGFLPWIKVSSGAIEPTSDWKDRVPALDNGEWAWSLYTAYHTLEDVGENNLAAEYKNYFDMLRKNAPVIFYDKQLRKIRAEVNIADTETRNIESSNYSNTKEGYYLDNWYEGLMMVYFLDLFTDLPQSEKDHIWDDIEMEKLTTKWGTVYKGWPEQAPFDGSPHIKWAFMFLPLTDNPMAMKIYGVQEKARTNMHKYGIPVSTNTPGAVGYTQYEPNVFGIYGTFSMIHYSALKGDVTQDNYGLAWLVNMLQVDKMQGPTGSGESYSVKMGPTGMTNELDEISFTNTVDGKMTLWLAMMGGNVNEVRDALKKDGKYNDFMAHVNREYTETFGDLASIKDNIQFRLPEPVKGKYTPKKREGSWRAINLRDHWQYPSLDKWGDGTDGVEKASRLIINYTGERNAHGWLGGGFRGTIVPVENSAFYFKGTGNFTIKLEGKDEKGKAVKVLMPVTLKGADEWTKISLPARATGKAFSVMVFDEVRGDIVINDMRYIPPKSAPKPVVKQPDKPAIKPAVKPDVKPDIKPDDKPAVKPDVEPAVKPAVKPAVEPEEKVAPDMLSKVKGFLAGLRERIFPAPPPIRELGVPPEKVLTPEEIRSAITELEGLLLELHKEGVFAISDEGIDFELDKDHDLEKIYEKLRKEYGDEKTPLTKEQKELIEKWLKVYEEHYSQAYKDVVIDAKVLALLQGKKTNLTEVEKTIRCERMIDRLGKTFWKPYSAPEIDNWTKVFMRELYLNKREQKINIGEREKTLEKGLQDKSDLDNWRGEKPTGEVGEVYQYMARLFDVIDHSQRAPIGAVDKIKQYLAGEKGIEEDKVIDGMIAAYKATGHEDQDVNTLVEKLKGPEFALWKGLRDDVEKFEALKDEFLREQDFSKRPDQLANTLKALDELLKTYEELKSQLGIEDELFTELDALVNPADEARKISEEDINAYKEEKPSEAIRKKVNSILKQTDLVIEKMAKNRLEELKEREKLMNTMRQAEKELIENLREAEEEASEADKNWFQKAWQRFTDWIMGMIRWLFGWEKPGLPNEKETKEFREALYKAQLIYNLDLYREKATDEYATPAAQLRLNILARQKGGRNKIEDEDIERLKHAITEKVINRVYLKAVHRSNGEELEEGRLGFLLEEIKLDNYIRVEAINYRKSLTDERVKEFVTSTQLFKGEDLSGKTEETIRERAKDIMVLWFAREKIAKYIKLEQFVDECEKAYRQNQVNPEEVPGLSSGTKTSMYMDVDSMDLTPDEEMEYIKNWFRDMSLVQQWSHEYLDYHLGYHVLSDTIRTMRKDFGIPILYNQKDRMKARFASDYQRNIASYRNRGLQATLKDDMSWTQRIVFGEVSEEKSETFSKETKAVIEKHEEGDARRIAVEIVERSGAFHKEMHLLLSRQAFKQDREVYLDDDGKVREDTLRIVNELDRLVIPTIAESKNEEFFEKYKECRKRNEKRLKTMFDSRKTDKDRWLPAKRHNIALDKEARHARLKELKAGLVGELGKLNEELKKQRIEPLEIQEEGLVWYFQKEAYKGGKLPEEMVNEAYRYPEQVRDVFVEVYGRIPTEREWKKITSHYVIKMIFDGWTLDYIKTRLIYQEYLKSEMGGFPLWEGLDIDEQAEILLNHSIKNGLLPVKSKELGIPIEELTVEKLQEKNLPISRVIKLTAQVIDSLQANGYTLSTDDINRVFFKVGYALDTNIAELISEKEYDLSRKEVERIVRAQLDRLEWTSKQEELKDDIVKGISTYMMPYNKANPSGRNIHPTNLVMLVDKVKRTRELIKRKDEIGDQDIARKIKLERTDLEILAVMDYDRSNIGNVIGIIDIPAMGIEKDSPEYKALMNDVKEPLNTLWMGLIKQEAEKEYEIRKDSIIDVLFGDYDSEESLQILEGAAVEIIKRDIPYENPPEEIRNEINTIIQELRKEQRGEVEGAAFRTIISIGVVIALVAALRLMAGLRLRRKIKLDKVVKGQTSGKSPPAEDTKKTSPAEEAEEAGETIDIKKPTRVPTFTRLKRAIFSKEALYLTISVIKVLATIAVLYSFKEATRFTLLFNMPSALLILSTIVAILLIYYGLKTFSTGKLPFSDEKSSTIRFLNNLPEILSRPSNKLSKAMAGISDTELSRPVQGMLTLPVWATKKVYNLITLPIRILVSYRAVIPAALFMYLSGAFGLVAINNVSVAIVAIVLVFAAVSSLTNLLVSFAALIKALGTGNREVISEYAHEVGAQLFFTVSLGVGLFFTYLYVVWTIALIGSTLGIGASSIAVLVALATIFYTICNYLCVAQIGPAAVFYVAGIITSIFKGRSVFDWPTHPAVEKTGRIPKKYRSACYTVGYVTNLPGIMLTFATWFRSYENNVKMVEVEENQPYMHKDASGKRWNVDPEDKLAAMMHLQVGWGLGVQFTDTVRRLLELRRRYGRDRVFSLHNNLQEGASHTGAPQMTKPGNYRRNLQYIRDGWNHPHLYTTRGEIDDTIKEITQVGYDENGNRILGPVMGAGPHDYKIDRRTGEIKIADEKGVVIASYNRGKVCRDHMFNKRENGFDLIAGYAIHLESNKYAREERLLKIDGEWKEVTFETEVYYVDAENPAVRYRVIQGDLYDDETGELVATKDMYLEDRQGYLRDRRDKARPRGVVGLNGRALPRKIKTVYEQFLHVKNENGRVVETLTLRKDETIVDSRGNVVINLHDINDGNLSENFWVRYRVCELDESGILRDTDISINRNRPNTYKGIPWQILLKKDKKKGKIAEASDWHIDQNTGNAVVEKIVEDSDWHRDQHAGDAIPKDGLILAYHGTWESDEDGNLCATIEDEQVKARITRLNGYLGIITKEDGRQFELQTYHAVPWKILEKFVDTTDQEGILIQPSEHTRMVARDNEWYVEQATGDAIGNDGLILARFGTWRVDRNGNLYVGGITAEEARIFAQEGGISDPFEMAPGKTGRETLYFIPDDTHSLTRDRQNNLIADPNELRLREVQGGYIACEKDGFVVMDGRLVQYPMDGSRVAYEESQVRDFANFTVAHQDNVSIDHETGELMQWQMAAKCETYALDGGNVYRRRRILAKYDEVYFDESGNIYRKATGGLLAQDGDFILDEDSNIRKRQVDGTDKVIEINSVPLQADGFAIDEKTGDLIVITTLANRKDYKIDEEGYAVHIASSQRIGRLGTYLLINRNGRFEHAQDMCGNMFEPDIAFQYIAQLDNKNEHAAKNIKRVISRAAYQRETSDKFGMYQAAIDYPNVGVNAYVRTQNWAQSILSYINVSKMWLFGEGSAVGKMVLDVQVYDNDVLKKKVIPHEVRSHDFWEAMHTPTMFMIGLPYTPMRILEETSESYFVQRNRSKRWVPGDVVALRHEHWPTRAIIQLLKFQEKDGVTTIVEGARDGILGRSYHTAETKSHILGILSGIVAETIFALWLIMLGMSAVQIPGLVGSVNPIISGILFGVVMAIILGQKIVMPIVMKLFERGVRSPMTWVNIFIVLAGAGVSTLILVFTLPYLAALTPFTAFALMMSIFSLVFIRAICNNVKGTALYVARAFKSGGLKQKLAVATVVLLCIAAAIAMPHLLYNIMPYLIIALEDIPSANWILWLAYNLGSKVLPYIVIPLTVFKLTGGSFITDMLRLSRSKTLQNVGDALSINYEVVQITRRGVLETIYLTTILMMNLLYRPIDIFESFKTIITGKAFQWRGLSEDQAAFRKGLSVFQIYRDYKYAPIIGCTLLLLTVAYMFLDIKILDPALVFRGFPIFIISWLFGPFLAWFTAYYKGTKGYIPYTLVDMKNSLADWKKEAREPSEGDIIDKILSIVQSDEPTLKDRNTIRLYLTDLTDLDLNNEELCEEIDRVLKVISVGLRDVELEDEQIRQWTHTDWKHLWEQIADSRRVEVLRMLSRTSKGRALLEENGIDSVKMSLIKATDAIASRIGPRKAGEEFWPNLRERSESEAVKIVQEILAKHNVENKLDTFCKLLNLETSARTSPVTNTWLNRSIEEGSIKGVFDFFYERTELYHLGKVKGGAAWQFADGTYMDQLMHVLGVVNAFKMLSEGNYDYFNNKRLPKDGKNLSREAFEKVHAVYDELMADPYYKEVLQLFVALHDYGKIWDGDHYINGTRKIAPLLEELEISEDKIKLIQALILRHSDFGELYLGESVPREDIEFLQNSGFDIDKFLKMLLILHICDVTAVGQGRLKADQLKQFLSYCNIENLKAMQRHLAKIRLIGYLNEEAPVIDTNRMNKEQIHQAVEQAYSETVPLDVRDLLETGFTDWEKKEIADILENMKTKKTAFLVRGLVPEYVIYWIYLKSRLKSLVEETTSGKVFFMWATSDMPSDKLNAAFNNISIDDIRKNTQLSDGKLEVASQNTLLSLPINFAKDSNTLILDTANMTVSARTSPIWAPEHPDILKAKYVELFRATKAKQDFESSELMPDTFYNREGSLKRGEAAAIHAYVRNMENNRDLLNGIRAAREELSEILGEGDAAWIRDEELHVNVFSLHRPFTRLPAEIRSPESIGEAMRIVAEAEAFDVTFTGISITPTGTIIATGLVDEGEGNLTAIRDRLRRLFPADRFKDAFRQNIIHVSLGRILQPLGEEKFKKLIQKIETLRNEELARVSIREISYIVARGPIAEEKVTILATQELKAAKTSPASAADAVALDRSIVDNIEKIKAEMKKADIIIGIPFYNEVASNNILNSKGGVLDVARLIEDLVAQVKTTYPDKRVAIVAIGESNEKGQAAFDEADRALQELENKPGFPENIKIFRFQKEKQFAGWDGKKWSIRSILTISKELNAEAAFILDGDLVLERPDKIKLFLDPVLRGETDIVSPNYARLYSVDDIAIADLVTQPLLAAAYGLRLGDPNGGDYGIRNTLFDTLLSDGFIWNNPLFESTMHSAIIRSGKKILDVGAGEKIHKANTFDAVDRVELYIKILFDTLAKDHDFWKGRTVDVNNILRAPPAYFSEEAMEGTSATYRVDITEGIKQNLIDTYNIGSDRLANKEWAKILASALNEYMAAATPEGKTAILANLKIQFVKRLITFTEEMQDQPLSAVDDTITELTMELHNQLRTSPLSPSDLSIAALQNGLRQIRFTQKEAVKSLKQKLRNNPPKSLGDVVSSLEFEGPVRTEINKILSAKLNNQGRENLAALIIFLTDEFGISVEGLTFQPAVEVPDGDVYAVVGYHGDESDAAKFVDAVRPFLPPIPTDLTTPGDAPVLAIHIENAGKGLLETILSQDDQVKNIKSPDDKEKLYRFYKKCRNFAQERSRKKGRSDLKLSVLDEKVADAFMRGLYNQIKGLINQGYNVIIFREDPEPETWWLWDRAELFFKDAAQCIVRGDVETLERLYEKADKMRYASDQRRDFEEEGPRITRAIKEFPKATHIVFRGLVHEHIADVLDIPEERKHLIHVSTDPEHLEQNLTPVNVLHRLRRSGRISGEEETELERKSYLQDALFNYLATLLVNAQQGILDVAPLLNESISELSAGDIRRLIKSFANRPRPRSENLLYELYYRMKTNFPETFPDDSRLVRLIEDSIQQAYGRPYVPLSTAISATSPMLEPELNDVLIGIKNGADNNEASALRLIEAADRLAAQMPRAGIIPRKLIAEAKIEEHAVETISMKIESFNSDIRKSKMAVEALESHIEYIEGILNEALESGQDIDEAYKNAVIVSLNATMEKAIELHKRFTRISETVVDIQKNIGAIEDQAQALEDFMSIQENEALGNMSRRMEAAIERMKTLETRLSEYEPKTSPMTLRGLKEPEKVPWSRYKSKQEEHEFITSLP